MRTIMPTAAIFAALSVTQAVAGEATLADRVLAAYRAVDTYASEVTYSTQLVRGRWSRTERTVVPIAFDRAAQRLLLDRPNIRLVADGNHLLMRVEQIPAAYLRQPTPQRPMDYDILPELLPALAEPAFPDLVLLLADDPWAVLAQGANPQITEPGPDADGHPQLDLVGPLGTMRLTLDPKTFLVATAVFTYDPAAANLANDVAMTERFTIEIRTHNEDLRPDAFVFDTNGRQAVDSLEDLFQATQTRPPHPLLGQPVPDVEFKDPAGAQVDITKLESSLIVLDFWAAWCGPCRFWMPQVAEINTWAKEQGYDAAFYFISVNQDAEEDHQFYEQMGLTLPLLYAADHKATVLAYGESSPGPRGGQYIPLPLTLVIREGRVIDAHIGVGPNTANELRQTIERHAAKKTDAEDAR